jgi:hypothetical protein
MSLITQGLGYDEVYDAPDPQGTLQVPPVTPVPVPPENGSFG